MPWLEGLAFWFAIRANPKGRRIYFGASPCGSVGCAWLSCLWNSFRSISGQNSRKAFPMQP